MEVLGQKVETHLDAHFAAAPGPTILGIAAPLPAPAVRPATASTLSVFELYVQRPGFFRNPLPY